MTIALNEPVAILADIHGNITALEAVLSDVRQRGIKNVVILGDLVGRGPNPAACVDVIQQLECPVIQGNWDELITRDPSKINDDMLEAIDWQRDQLGANRLEYLRNLPLVVHLERYAGLVRLLHASPQGLWHGVGIGSIINGKTEKLVGMFASTELTGFVDRTPIAVGYGDIHVAYVLTFPGFIPEFSSVQGRMLFNVGSVGNPIDMPIPVYGILGAGLGLELTLVRVPYDNELECKRAVTSGLPHPERYLHQTRFAGFRLDF
jgi:protein phosphatase